MTDGDGKTRCDWGGDDPLMLEYHDREWGVPIHDDRHLFELLCLEGAQAGLSWRTVLHRREGYRRLFVNFAIAKVAAFDEEDVERLLLDKGIIRNRAKVNSAIKNARAALKVIEEFGSLDEFIWSFVDGKTIVTKARDMGEVPAETPESQAMSKALKERGFNFVGPTICYAYMQSAGMVNDHATRCFRHDEV
jgi:DNA-3-methyladenine glycosylase I